MATVLFYEKPGCINNTKQKALLKAAGHTVEPRNLLTEAWTVETLHLFFADLPVAEWLNPTAPRVKSGEIIPDQLDAEMALLLMVDDPLLIRRPLMQVGDRRVVGFNQDEIAAWIGLEAADTVQQTVRDQLIQQDLQTCPSSKQSHPIPCKSSEV
ncbi:ArsC/Spx/MgsR family protein [Egbenema bharatensis]|uniref:ArsC/Spx/MgsR family protein n=1 Tax=Egbenema bharatensis TaxID=3463334 RepID=UPI003A86CC24